MNAIKTLALAAVLGAASLSTFAQNADPQTPRVDKREARQQKRIANGVASGQLTAKEAAHVEKQQVAIENAEANAKADGKVTAAERHRLERMQNHSSRSIARQKHDAQTAAKP